jgi:hypothetical protein
MKSKIYLSSLLFVFFLTITSCKKEEETKANVKYDGKWTLTENCSPSGPASYPITIIRDPADPLKFSMTGIWEIPSSLIVCSINSGDKNTFSAERQKISASFDIEILTSVTNSSGNIIYISYKIYSTGSLTTADVCTGRLTPII